MSGRKLTWLCLLVPVAVVFLDGQWEVVSRLVGSEAEGALPPVVGVLVGTALARLFVLAGPMPAITALVVGQLLTPQLRDAGDVPAFAAAAFQGVAIALLIRLAADRRAGVVAVPDPWSLGRARDLTVAFAVPVALALLAWWSGFAAWLAGMLGDERSGPLMGIVAALPALWLAIAAHELGHAVMARRRLGGRVTLRVGQFGKAVDVTVGGVRAQIHMLDVVSGSGAVEVDASHLTADDLVAVAVAGPAASLLAVVLGVPVLAALPADSGLVHSLAWWFVLNSVIGVLNLLPFRIRLSRAGGPISSDGRQILDALAVKWALR